jgi:predicted RNA methylase
MKQAVDDLYQVFSKITGVTIDQLNQDKDIMLPSGKAIGVAAAAHCLLEMKRTAVFLRGINKAILQKLQERKGNRLRILYAGTGPYGTLVIPLLLLYSKEEIKVDWLDINPNALNALQKVIETLEVADYTGDIYCSDATTIQLSYSYDIAISETMQACLKNEPQVAVMQNLIPQLNDECIFIPEEIKIDASLTNPKMEMERLLYYDNNEQHSVVRRSLGNIFAVSKNELYSIGSRTTIIIPADVVPDFPVLKLFTTVRIFDNEILTDNDSSITLPQLYYDFRKQQVRSVEFWYVPGEKPRIESKARKNIFSEMLID